MNRALLLLILLGLTVASTAMATIETPPEAEREVLAADASTPTPGNDATGVGQTVAQPEAAVTADDVPSASAPPPPTEAILRPLPPSPPPKPVQDTFLIEALGSNVYAAITKIGGRASSNTMFVIGEHYVVAVGAHMTKEVIRDLYAEIASRTGKPIRYFVLAHHHPGYSHVDFDFPANQDVIMAWQAWQQLNDNVRKPEFPIIFFNEGMTIKPGGVTIVLSNLGRGHSAGDVVTYIPEAGVIFASDLFYVDSVGYMAGGFMREWILALEALEQLGADRIIPGTGPVSSRREVSEFKEFFRDFLTELIRHIERGDSLDQVLQNFDLPKYRHLSGYQLLLKANLRRAYEELKIEFGR
jgi:glyoxylase-like metal-dependent hydrolase (beta-lactamase superfamily II)